MTTGQSSVQAPAPVPQAGACKFEGRRRGRKFKRACCCVVFLLLINAFLLMHTAHSVGAIMWFMINGSYTYDDTTYIFVPGGAKTLCNDLCVDLCIYKPVGCELNSCLNTCNQQLIDDGNPEDDWKPLPPSHPIVNELIIEMEPMTMDSDTDIVIDPVYFADDEGFLPPMETEEVELLYPVDYIDEVFVTEEGDDIDEIELVDTPQAPEYDDDEIDDDVPVLVDTPQAPEYDDDGQLKLDAMQKVIEASAEKIRQWKANYVENCGENPDTKGCGLKKEAINKAIETLKKQIDGYNSFAIEIHVEISVQVWMVDVDDVTAEP